MGDGTIRSEGATRARPAARPAAPASRPAAGPAANGNGIGRDTLDTNGYWTSAQTAAQGAVRAGAVVAKTASHGKAFVAFANVLEGDRLTIARGVDRALTRVAGGAARLAPAHADTITKVAGPLIRGTGTALRWIGKAAPALSVVSAAWDTTKAVAETDPTKKAGAWANAGLSIGGTALAIGAVAIGATPIGWAAAIGAAAVCGYQLVDSLAFDGKGTAAIGNTVKGWFSR